MFDFLLIFPGAARPELGQDGHQTVCCQGQQAEKEVTGHFCRSLHSYEIAPPVVFQMSILTWPMSCSSKCSLMRFCWARCGSSPSENCSKAREKVVRSGISCRISQPQSRRREGEDWSMEIRASVVGRFQTALATKAFANSNKSSRNAVEGEKAELPRVPAHGPGHSLGAAVGGRGCVGTTRP